jgi:chromate transporter
MHLGEVAVTFLRLGLTSFGGPVAHLGFLRAECVERRQWLTDADFAELVALCSFLPGPTSSQVVFALGSRRAGLPGALVASACFLAPSAAVMTALAMGLHAVGGASGGWVHGLKLAAVAVVAQAVWAMQRTLSPDGSRRAMALAGALAVWWLPTPWTQVAVLAAGALVGRLLHRSGSAVAPTPFVWSARALAPLLLFLLLAAVLGPLADALDDPWLERSHVFFRAGSLVFGGGHVVLPLLRDDVVPRGWLTDDAFLAGYGAVQAMPGPLFSLAGYLGALSVGAEGPRALAGSALGLVSVFLPGFLLVDGALPLWRQLETRPALQAAVRGANAAVVGVLLAALVDPVARSALATPVDAVVAVAAFTALQLVRAPPWLVVVLCAAVGWAL